MFHLGLKVCVWHLVKAIEMKYRTLGKCNLQVSVLFLGTMMFGDQTAHHEVARTVPNPNYRANP